MKTIFFDVPPSNTSLSGITVFCDNPAIKVHKIEPVPAGDRGQPKIMVVYESLADPEAMERAVKYETLTLKRLARVAETVNGDLLYKKLKNQTQREIHLLAFFGVSKVEADVVIELILMPQVRQKLLEET